MIMRTPAALALLAGAALFVAAPGFAHEDHHGDADAAPAAVGAQFMVMETSANDAARAPFVRGLALLHNFEYASAADAFRRALEFAPGRRLSLAGLATTQTR